MGVINKMGLELEGAWHGTIRVPPFKDAKIKHDGSVRFQQPTDGTYLHYGELVSEPMDPEEIAQWGYDHCPTAADNSAGTHLHFSLETKTMYGCLLTPSFQRMLMQEYTRFNEMYKDLDPETYERFKNRLAGTNRFCKKGYKGLSQVTMSDRGSDRYHQVNYCYKLHGTIEIRVLPCTTNREFLKGVILLTRDVIRDFVGREHITKKIRFRRS
jgi:hypothetical protein